MIEPMPGPKGTPPVPLGLLVVVYVLYIGLATTSSVPLFADIDWLHEGERLGTAQILLDGGRPFRDVYLPHGLFPEVIRPLLAMQLFGESLLADRFMGLILAPLAYVAAVFYVWKVFPSPTWRLTALVGVALYPLQLLPRHIIVFLALGVLTSWIYEQEKRIRLVIAGALAGSAYVVSTMEHATFLLGTMLAFPICLTYAQIQASRTSLKGGSALQSGFVLFGRVAGLLWGGLLLGLLSFVVYLGVSGTIQAFSRDFITRILTDLVTKRDPYPNFTLFNMSWYVIPACYVCLAAVIVVRVWRFGDQRWDPIFPTLLFGFMSFAYAMHGCCPTYGRLAVVSFPFVVVFVYVLMVAKAASNVGKMPSPTSGLSNADRWLLTLTGAGGAGLLIHSLVRDWNAKQTVPKILFPLLALALLAAIEAVLARQIKDWRWKERLVIICPLALLIVGAWFYNDAKPQILTAQLKKPKLAQDVRRLAGGVATEKGRLTREWPLYVHDETLSYLKTAYRDGKHVVILATGAGIYYFLSGVSPPNRFPEVYHAMADGPAEEVVAGLLRTKAELFVACKDEGREITGWPMNPKLANFIAANYVDSGRRLNSKLLGQGCPFSIWTYRGVASSTGAMLDLTEKM